MIDASIYQNLKPIEMPDVLGTAGKAMSLRQMSMQNDKLAQDQEQEKQKQKRLAMGLGLEQVAALPKDQQPQAYDAMLKEMNAKGILQPQEMTPYEVGFPRGYAAWKVSPEHAALDKERAEAAYKYAEAAKARADAGNKGNPAKRTFEQLPPESQELIKDTTKKASDMAMIRNKLEADMKILGDPGVPEDVKMAHRKSMLKTLNSTLGKDVVGAEEANRLAPFLEAQGVRALVPGNPGSMFSAHPEKFDEQVKLSIASLNDSLNQSNQMIAKAYGGANPIQGKAYVKQPKGGGTGGGGPVSDAYAGDKSPPIGAGAVVEVRGKHYTVGPDGETLTPVQGKGRR